MKFVYALLALALVGSAIAQKPPTGQAKQGNSMTQQVNDAKLKQLESAYTAAKTAFTKKPKDAKVKKSFVNAAFAVGMGRMYSESLPPRQKYSSALTAFREVMKVQPDHKLAKQNYDLIAKIYKDMGRPVPGEK